MYSWLFVPRKKTHGYRKVQIGDIEIEGYSKQDVIDILKNIHKDKGG